MNLQLTKKLNDKLKKDLFEINLDECNEFEDYHCNLIKYGRDNCVLITHNTTLFSFVLYGLKAKGFKDFEFLLKEHIFKVLLALEFSQEQIEKVLTSMENINYAKTNSRSVLGSMNEMVYHVDEYLYRNTDIILIHKKINEIPYKAIDYSFPIEKFKLLLDNL